MTKEGVHHVGGGVPKAESQATWLKGVLRAATNARPRSETVPRALGSQRRLLSREMRNVRPSGGPVRMGWLRPRSIVLKATEGCGAGAGVS